MSQASQLAYEASPVIHDEGDLDFRRNAIAEHALATHGGMEGFGRLVDGEIARLRDRLSRERDKTRGVHGDLNEARYELGVEQRRTAANQAAYARVVKLAQELGATEAALLEIEDKRNRALLVAQTDAESIPADDPPAGSWAPADFQRSGHARTVASSATDREPMPEVLIQGHFPRHVGDTGVYPAVEPADFEKPDAED